jgi:hypothetical protein
MQPPSRRGAEKRAEKKYQEKDFLGVCLGVLGASVVAFSEIAVARALHRRVSTRR